MGVSSAMDDFFATSTVFRNVRTGEKEGPRQHQYRQEIWTWMDSSLSKGMYRWVTRSIPCVYDIHALYTKVFNMANKATFISQALEFKKIFSIACGSDIFAYHAEILEQIKLVKVQGETLGLNASIPPWMEQALLLLAAWQIPHYRKIALEFTMNDAEVSIETLVREFEKQRLLTTPQPVQRAIPL